MKKFLSHLNAGSFLWNLISILHFFFKHNTISLVKKNKVLRNKYSGKRCFVVGNGPSLKKINSSLLKDEYVITVNFIAESDFFKNVDPIFHVFADQAFFKECNKEMFAEQIKKISVKSNTTLCIPAIFKDFFEKSKKECDIDSIYYNCLGYYKNIKSIDFAKCIPSFNKVVHYAICLAIYLGFAEIYLLGCDETAIETTINLLLNGQTNNDHCYDDSDANKQMWKEELDSIGIHNFFSDQALVFSNYKRLNDFCKKKGISIFNLSERSLIDSIEKKTLKEVL